MHRSTLYAAILVTTIGLFTSSTGAQVPVLGAIINGIQVTPGPGITGIKSDADITHLSEENILGSQSGQQGSLSTRSTPAPYCSIFWPQTAVSEIKSIQSYLAGLPNNQSCVVQTSQYKSDCGAVSCTTLATTVNGEVEICIAAQKNNANLATSFAAFSCNTLATYVQNQINTCTNSTNTKIASFTYIDPNDYSMSNNANGNNFRGSQSVWVLSGQKQ